LERILAEARIRDADGQLRRVSASASSAAAARRQLMQKLQERPGHGNGGVLTPSSSFNDLAELWLADLELRDLAIGTKQTYRDQLRPHVRPALEHYTLGEITTGRVDRFLRSQAAVSQSRGRQSRTLLNLLFAFALRQDAITRNPVEGTSSLRAGPRQTQGDALAPYARGPGVAPAWPPCASASPPLG
jgi:hypothetical protein